MLAGFIEPPFYNDLHPFLYFTYISQGIKFIDLADVHIYINIIDPFFELFNGSEE